MTPEEFYAQYMPYAQGVSQRTGLDPRLVLAQAALETGYGKSAPNSNFFGIKSHGRDGGQTLQTSEFEGGRMVGQPASFRGYESPSQSFQDYGEFIMSNPRYEGVRTANGLGEQIVAMANSGYATDPQYGEKLASIATRFNPNSPAIIGAETMAALGKQPMQGRASTRGAAPMMQEEQQPRGLLGTLGIQKMQEGAAGETGQRFYERDTFKDTAAALAQGFAAMGSSPALQKMTADISSQRTEAKARNKTVEYLRANGRGDLADMVEQNVITGKDAASVLLAKPEDGRTALVKNYEYFIAQGMTPEQAIAAVKTGSTTNVNMPKPVGTIPQGYAVQYDDAGNPISMSPIPGGPAATEAAAAATVAKSEGSLLAQSATDQIALIDDIIKDKALPSITGLFQGRLPPTSQAGEDLNVKIAQLQGKVFLEAFQSLKGGGAITEREGTAAAEAGARLRRTQSGPAYIEALEELKMYLDRGRRRALAGVTAQDGDAYSGGTIGGVIVGEPIE